MSVGRSKSERPDGDAHRTPRGLDDPRRTPRGSTVDKTVLGYPRSERASSVSTTPRASSLKTSPRVAPVEIFEIELRDLQALCSAGLVKREDLNTLWNYFKSSTLIPKRRLTSRFSSRIFVHLADERIFSLQGISHRSSGDEFSCFGFARLVDLLYA